MRKPIDRILVWVLLPIVVCAVMFGVEALMQLPKLSLPAEQSGLIALDTAAARLDEVALPKDEVEANAQAQQAAAEDAAESEESGTTEEEIFGEEAPAEATPLPEGALNLALPTTAATFKTEDRYINDLTFTGAPAASQSYYVIWFSPDNTLHTAKSFFISDLGQDTVHIGAEVNRFFVRFPGGETIITGVSIDNRFVLNTSRMLFSALMTACLYLLIAFRGFIGKHAEYGFLAVALAVGLFLSIALPADVNLSFDDQIHYDHVQRLSSFSKTSTTTRGEAYMAAMSWSPLVNGSYLYRLDTYADEQHYYEVLDALGEDTSEPSTNTAQWGFTDIGYVTQSAGYGLAKLLGRPFHAQMIWARAANLLTYVLLCFFGIRALKRFKLTMSAMALMPTPLFLAANFSYDPTSIGLCFLGISLVMDAILDRETKLTWQRGLGILLCFVLGALTKVVYMPLLLLVVLLPRSKFDSNTQRVWYKVGAAVLCIVALYAMVSNVLGDTSTLEDSRGDNVDSAGQIAFLMSHPITYLGYFFSYLWENVTVYFLDSPRVTWAYVGATTTTVSTLSLMLILMACFTDNDPDFRQKLNWKQRLYMLIIGGLVVGMVFTTMYVAFSPVGERNFGGVQGRYLLPVLPLFFMLLCPDGVQNRMNKSGWHLFFYGGNLLLLGCTCFNLVCQNLLK